MRVAIMQPYIFPYIGYFQLIKAVDVFVVYDNIQYTKKGWINRNRFLQNEKDVLFTIPLKKDSDFLDVKERLISTDFNKTKLLRKIENSYKNAPYFKEVYFLLHEVLINNESNLFDYIYYSIKETCRYLNIETKIIKSSTVNIDHTLKSQDKVIAICRNLGAQIYINSVGGQALYSKTTFEQFGLDLKFIESNKISYMQFNHEFVPWLSIIDVLMFNDVETVRKMIDNYKFI